METLAIRYHDQAVGVVSYDAEKGLGAFEYEPSFIKTGIDLSPVYMPLKQGIYVFPELVRHSFHGLPGMVSDSLPDDFGNAVLNTWIARQGRSPTSISPLERL